VTTGAHWTAMPPPRGSKFCGASGSPTLKFCDVNLGPLACFVHVSGLKRRNSEGEVNILDDRQSPTAGNSSPATRTGASAGLEVQASQPLPASDEHVEVTFADADGRKKEKSTAVLRFESDTAVPDTRLSDTKLISQEGQHAWAVQHGYELSLDEVVHLKTETDAMVQQLSEALCEDNPSIDRQVFAAVHRGRWIEASRVLKGVEGSQDQELADNTVSASIRTRIHRVASRFDESLKDLCDLPELGEGDWNQEDEGVAFKLSNEEFKVVATKHYENFDAFQAFVGLCEYDLCPEYLSTVKRATLLHENVEPSPNDTVWQVQQRSHTSKEDNILQVSCIDALDEPLGALWFSVYTPDEEDVGHIEELRGVKVPPPKEGCVRVRDRRTVFAIYPVWSNPPSFKLTMALSRRPSSAAMFFSSVVQREAKDIMETFHKFLGKCSDLNGRALFSPRAPFYECVRRHLVDLVPRCCSFPGKVIPNPLLRLTFHELSGLLPEDWADHIDAATCKEAAAADSPKSLVRKKTRMSFFVGKHDNAPEPC